MPQTISEQIISAHAGKAVTAGEIVIVPVDGAMATDATAPFAIRAFEAMGGDNVWDASKISLILDHATPAPNERVANLHQMMREFATKHGIKLYDVGAGICHQLMVENDHVRPGHIFTGADSHTPTYGALGAFAVGMGSADIAAVWKTGKTWLKVPHTIQIKIDGELQTGVCAKDIILHIVGRLGIAGATYDAIEFTGSTVATMTLASRMVLANMVAEMGAKAGLVDTTNLELPYTFAHYASRPDATYRAKHTINISELEPQIAVPHSPDAIRPISTLLGTRIDAAFIGSCTNSRLEDLQAAAEVVRGQTLKTRLIIAPASRHIFNQAMQDGTLATLSAAGASFITSGCGPCVGTHQGVPGDGEAVISSTNRNFRGRMGNPNAEIYLASPAVVAAAAVAGRIVRPSEIMS